MHCRGIIIRPRCSTACIEAACCQRLSSVICLLVGLSVCHSSEPCKDGLTDQDTIWLRTQGRGKESCIRWGPDVPQEEATHCKVQGHSAVSCAKTAEPTEMLFGYWLGWAKGIMYQVVTQIHPWEGSILRGRAVHCKLQGSFDASCAKVAIWEVDSGAPKEAFIKWESHWRHVANTIEPPTISVVA